MRYLEKPAQPPDCITGFIQRQLEARARDAEEDPENAATAWERHPVNYAAFQSARLLPVLEEHQRGLCGYTGVALDDRLATHQPDKPRRFWYMPHVEHLKPQSQCRAELEARGGQFGRDLCADMDHRNMIAAIEVGGISSEWFGAVKRGHTPLPLLPTDEMCHEAFEYFEDGRVKGRSPEARQLIDLLDLNHKSLLTWRRAALEAEFPDGSNTVRIDIEALLGRLATGEGPLPEFAFILESFARDYLAMHADRQA